MFPRQPVSIFERKLVNSSLLRTTLRSRLTPAILACTLLATCLAAGAQRLPAGVTPTHYALTVTPDIAAAAFTGLEKIDVTIAAPTRTVSLNAIELALQSVTVFAAGKRQTASVSLDASKEQATFTFANEIPAGQAKLEIHFTGVLNNELRGFYLSRTAKRNYAVTQFESTDARRAFPCFDEPALKATYDVTLIVDAADTAISNSPIASDTPGPGAGKHSLVFSTTPKMSTYLVAFLVGDFQCTSGESDGVQIRACATPDKVALTPYSLDAAKSILHYYNTYFGIPYPLKKLDLIAIPDFEAGAMENFGAITYRETDMLLDPKTASENSKREVALVVAHEMAHQWFGDMVTMEWWNNIWLNEGFASWMENKPVAAMHPEWHIDQMVAADEQRTLTLDSQPTTRSIRAPQANSPDEINQLFDGISYGKAGAVLLMVENYVGEETFRKGVHNYLAAHMWSNATAEDFWNAQTTASHKPVDKVMESLVTQPGEPLLTFGEVKNGQVEVAQRRFFAAPGENPDAKQQWTLPVCFKTTEGNPCELLTPEKSRLTPPMRPLLFANAGGKGYYRTAYAPGSYKALSAKAETSLTPAERISLAGDELAKVRANTATVSDYLDLLAALRDDSSSTVLSNAFGGMSIIYNQAASSDEERKALAAWVRKTFAPEYKKLGPQKADDSLDKRQLRSELFGILGYYGQDPSIAAQARQIADASLADPASIDPALAQTAMSIAAQHGDSALFDKLQQLYETSTNPDSQERALRLLAQFTRPELVQRSLEYNLSGKVRNQDAAIQFGIGLNVQETRAATWSFVKTNWDQVHALLTTAMGGILVSATGNFCSAAERDDVKSFFAAHGVASSGVSLRHAIERIDGCTQLRALQEPNLKNWLAAQAVPPIS